MTAKIVLLAISAAVFGTTAQILFKKSVNAVDSGKSLRGMRGHLEYFRNILSKNTVWAGLFSQIVCLTLWVMALAQADLSFVFPLGSAQYIFILFGSHVFLNEKINKMKLASAFLIVVGIVLITIS
jgi:drug/metabolite transporter (DMT)-like permease